MFLRDLCSANFLSAVEWRFLLSAARQSASRARPASNTTIRCYANLVGTIGLRKTYFRLDETFLTRPGRFSSPSYINKKFIKGLPILLLSILMEKSYFGFCCGRYFSKNNLLNNREVNVMEKILRQYYSLIISNLKNNNILFRMMLLTECQK